MQTIYHLKNNPENITRMQRASLSEGTVGLRITHGLIGSSEWWQQIERGELPLHSVSGVVSGFWPGQWESGPAEFELQQSDGSTSRWLCEIDVGKATQFFSAGKAAQVEYVIQELKSPFGGSDEAKVPISISLGQA